MHFCLLMLCFQGASHYQKGLEAFSTGHYQEAIRSYQQTETAPDDLVFRARISFRIGEAYYQWYKQNQDPTHLFLACDHMIEAHQTHPEPAFDALSKEVLAAAQGMTRSARSIDLSLTRGFHAQPTVRLQIFIQFETDSDQLTQTGLAQMAQLALALREQEGEPRFRIVGHTDAVGSDDHNQDLSERRAQTVMNELLAREAVVRSRMLMEGRGKRQLLYADSGANLYNRRVEVELIKP